MYCKKCGRLLHHIITSLKGKRFFACSGCVTTMSSHMPGYRGQGFLKSCGGVYDENNKPYVGEVVFSSGSTVKPVRF